jgi:hypothetical protein
MTFQNDSLNNINVYKIMLDINHNVCLSFSADILNLLILN